MTDVEHLAAFALRARYEDGQLVFEGEGAAPVEPRMVQKK